MAAGNAIASGAVILTAQADGLVNGLQKSQAQVTDWGNKTANEAAKASDKIGHEVEQSFHKTESKMGKAFGKLAKHGGFLGTLGGGLVQDFGFGAGAIGAAAVIIAVNQISKLLDDVDKTVKKLNESLAESGKKLERSLGLSKEWRDALVENTEGRKGKIASLEQEMLDRTKRINELEAPMMKPIHPGQGASAKELSAYFAALDIYKKLQGEAGNDLRKQIEEQKKAIDDASESVLRLQDRTKDPAFVGIINKTTAAIENQALTWGLDERAAERALLVNAGATEKMLVNLDAANAKLKSLAETNSLDPMFRAAIGFVDKVAPFLKEQKPPPWMTQALMLAGAIGKEFDHLKTWEQSTINPMFNVGLQIFQQTVAGVLKNASFDLSGLIDKAKSASQEIKSAPLAMRGSVEDYRLTVQNQFNDAGRSPADKTTDAVKEGNRRLDKAVNRLDQINNKLGDWEVV